MKILPVRHNPAFSGRNNYFIICAAILILSTPIYAQNNTPPALPDCFIYGIDKTENKSYEQIFFEIDNLSKPDNELSSEEVVLATRKLWKNTHKGEEMPIVEEYYAEDTFERLAKNYNTKNSDEKTIDFAEYMAIMNDYEKE